MPSRLLLPALAFCVASALQAQVTDTTTRSATPKLRKTVVSINPFAVFALYFAGDVETVVSPTASVGAGFSNTGIDDYNNYSTLEVKARYYPSEKAPEGFSIAGTAGVATASGADCSNGCFIGPGTSLPTTRATRGTVGTELSYQWLLGPKRRFVTVLGLGVKRFLGREAVFDPLSVSVLPTARVNIGIAF